MACRGLSLLILHLCVLYLFTSPPHTLIELLLFGCDVIGSTDFWILGRSLAGQLTCLFLKVKLHVYVRPKRSCLILHARSILFACLNIVVDFELLLLTICHVYDCCVGTGWEVRLTVSTGKAGICLAKQDPTTEYNTHASLL